MTDKTTAGALFCSILHGGFAKEDLEQLCEGQQEAGRSGRAKWRAALMDGELSHLVRAALVFYDWRISENLDQQGCKNKAIEEWLKYISDNYDLADGDESQKTSPFEFEYQF